MSRSHVRQNVGGFWIIPTFWRTWLRQQLWWRGLMSDNTDPVVRTGRREALIVVGIWLTAAAWSLTTSYRLGYNRPVEELKLIWGFPEWTFWGVAVPWVVCVVISWVFGVLFVHDAHLGEELPEDADELGLGG